MCIYTITSNIKDLRVWILFICNFLINLLIFLNFKYIWVYMLISISIYVHIYKPAKPKRPEGLDSFHMHFFFNQSFNFQASITKKNCIYVDLGNIILWISGDTWALVKGKFVNSTVFLFLKFKLTFCKRIFVNSQR